MKSIKAAGPKVIAEGLATSNTLSSLPNAMLNNPTIGVDVGFIPYQQFGKDLDTNVADLAVFKAIIAGCCESNFPFYITSWNHKHGDLTDLLNSQATNAISYVGKRPVTCLKARFVAASILNIRSSP